MLLEHLPSYSSLFKDSLNRALFTRTNQLNRLCEPGRFLFIPLVQCPLLLFNLEKKQVQIAFDRTCKSKTSARMLRQKELVIH